MTFSPSWLLIAILSAALFVAGYGWKSEHDNYITFKAGVIAAGEAQEEKTRETIKRHEKAAQEASNAYSRRIADIRSYYRVSDSPRGSKLPTTAKAPEGADGNTAYDVLAGDCAITTAQLVTLQEFISSTADQPEVEEI